MADDNSTTYKLERTIALTPLKPNEYLLWVVQTEATFGVHKCLDIVLGNEPNPTPIDDDGTPLGPIGQRLQATITSWETRYALATEALLKALQPADLLKVLAYRNSAPDIWTRLRDEYGRRLDFEYIRVNSEFQSLRKTKEVTMDVHITHFNQLLQEVEYNKSPEIPAMKSEAVNLQFFQSLGQEWEVFVMAKGDNIRTLSTAELHAEVRALDSRNNTTTQPPPSQPEPARALVSQFGNNGYRDCNSHENNWNNGGYNKGNSNGFRGRSVRFRNCLFRRAYPLGGLN